MEALTLHSRHLRAVVLPGAGGGLARLDYLGRAPAVPLLRPFEPGEGAVAPASQLACFPLVPWSNRMDPDGFHFEGRHVRPAPNRPGEPCPIHGDGWRLPWRVAEASDSAATLLLDQRGAAPFAYTASVCYVLDEDSLRVRLAVTNMGAAALPFGLGMHPWLPRRPGVTLRACAQGTWTRGPLGLPREAVALPPDWDFSSARVLPRTHVDHVFRGWDGHASVTWPDARLRLEIGADMGYYILYAPVDADFFCFEPVDHAINAHNLAGGARRNGLSVLAPNQALAREVRFRVRDLAGV